MCAIFNCCEAEEQGFGKAWTPTAMDRDRLHARTVDYDWPPSTVQGWRESDLSHGTLNEETNEL